MKDNMEKIKIHRLHTGKVCVSPYLPFGGDKCSIVKAAGLTTKKKDRLWLPVSAYLIECRHGLVLFDCGWHRDISPNGKYDGRAQIKSLGGIPLFMINQGVAALGETVDEQLAAMGIRDTDLDTILISHLDCDHVSGLKSVSGAKKILVSNEEIAFASKKTPVNMIRYHSVWWDCTGLEGFDWNGTEGPANKSFDVFGDGSFVMVNIPGHSDGQCALKITDEEGKFVLLFSDGGYARRSWEEIVTSGISADKIAQKKSLEWIRDQSLNPCCAESLANHDPDVIPHVIEL